MSKLLALPLLIILLSCQHTPTPSDTFEDIQSSIKLAPVVEIDGKKYIPVEGSECYERTYRVSLEYIGGIRGTTVVKDVYECNLIKGYKPKIDTEFVSFMQYVQSQINGQESEPLIHEPLTYSH
jgi:hypothetical protein